MYETLFRFYFRLHDFFEQRFFYHVCKWLKKPHPKNLYDFRTRDFLKHIQSSDRVADLGAGTGKLASAMAKQAQAVIAVDLNQPLQVSGFEFLKSDILEKDLPMLLQQKGINVITLSHILEHIEHPVALLKSLNFAERILICVPSQENWRYQFKQSLGLDARTDPTHYREYTQAMLQEEIQKAGLTMVSIHYNSEGEIFASVKR